MAFSLLSFFLTLVPFHFLAAVSNCDSHSVFTTEHAVLWQQQHLVEYYFHHEIWSFMWICSTDAELCQHCVSAPFPPNVYLVRSVHKSSSWEWGLYWLKMRMVCAGGQMVQAFILWSWSYPVHASQSVRACSWVCIFSKEHPVNLLSSLSLSCSISTSICLIKKRSKRINCS